MEREGSTKMARFWDHLCRSLRVLTGLTTLRVLRQLKMKLCRSKRRLCESSLLSELELSRSMFNSSQSYVGLQFRIWNDFLSVFVKVL